jgi:hypothetical protein
VVFLPSRTTGNVGRFRDMLIEFSGLLARKSSKRHLPLAYLFMPTPGQSDAPITDMDANFLESWMWAKHPSLAAALENSIFEALDDTTAA